MKLKKGLVHIYTGEGKGKTTAALGLALRAAGCGLRVCFLQFFKEGLFPCGESDMLKRFGRNFKFKRFDIPHPMFKKIAPVKFTTKLNKVIKETKGIVRKGGFDMVILDEIIVGVSGGFIDEKDILDIIRARPRDMELILTGRGATKRLIKQADYVTYMKELKHPFNNGVASRRGIEF